MKFPMFVKTVALLFVDISLFCALEPSKFMLLTFFSLSLFYHFASLSLTYFVKCLVLIANNIN